MRALSQMIKKMPQHQKVGTETILLSVDVYLIIASLGAGQVLHPPAPGRGVHEELPGLH